MFTESIVKQSTAAARQTVLFALCGAGAIVVGVIIELVSFGNAERTAAQQLVTANRIADEILLADERLTMSANMAAATGEERWIKRYEANIPLIDDAIRRASGLAPPDVGKEFDAKTRYSNDRLVALERASFAAARAGDAKAAQRILNSGLYAFHKRVLNDGTRTFINSTIAAQHNKLEEIEGRSWVAIPLALLVSLICATFLWRRLHASLSRSESAFLHAENTIHALAMNDALTGMPNRRALCTGLQKALTRAERERTYVATLMVDLDRFKPINDQYGHGIGDVVLKEVARRLNGVLRDGEVRARFGGDEFVAVVEYSGGRDSVRQISHRLIEALAEPMMLDGLRVQVGASIGVAVYPTDATTEADLLRKADLALYRAKQQGRGTLRFYDVSMEVDGDAVAQLEDELRHAVSSGAIVPYFQPLVDLESGRTRGFEMLCRWLHPTRGLLPPTDFIPLAETAGLIDQLTIAMLRIGCTQARVLPSTMMLALNLAPRQIEDDWLAHRLLAVLTETGFPAQRLEIEITEHALVSDFAAAKNVITSMRNLGIRIALDDFGTGYSSLYYLAELPFDTIKIDRSLIATLHERDESRKIVTAIVGLGKSLGVSTVAEGVENERTVDFLRSIGCAAAQGYHFGKPMPIADAVAYIDGESLATKMRAMA
jgi:diguanylate cyclase (GGDEF)-like protein